MKNSEEFALLSRPVSSYFDSRVTNYPKLKYWF